MTTSASPDDEKLCLVCGELLSPDYSGCYRCDKSLKQQAEEEARYASYIGGPRAWQQFTFEKYKTTATNGKALAALKAYDPRSQNLYIMGPTGTGKTHLAVAAARAFIKKVPVHLLKMYTLAREVRDCNRASEEAAVIAKYVHAGVLILDDLGVSKDTEFSTTVMYELIDGRYMNRPGGLIVTSNLNLDKLAEKLGDDRISSRLAQMCQFVNMDGEPDRRVTRI